jgi:major membrane immunogen (membrane-anchored lipoprotein)
MLKANRLFFIIGVLISIMLLTACGAKDAHISKTQTPYYIVDIDPQDPALSDDENGWKAIDKAAYNEKISDNEKFIYLTEDHPEVAAVNKFIEEFTAARYNRDYKTMDGNEVTPYLTQSYLQNYVSRKLAEDDLQDWTKYEAVTKFAGIKSCNIVFNKDFTKARVDYTLQKIFVSANNKFLKETNLKTGTVYSQDIVADLVKENNIWKIYVTTMFSKREK